MSTYIVNCAFIPTALRDIPDPPEIRRCQRAYQRHLESVRRRRRQAEEQREMLISVLDAMASVLPRR